MSKPRYDWWGYVKSMIRRYPALKDELSDLHSTSETVNYSGMLGGSGASLTTELTAIRELPTNKQREYEAVRRAIATTERYRDGRDRLKVIKLVLWDGTYTLEGAALQIPCSFWTAQNWHCEFIRLVASYYGFMDE